MRAGGWRALGWLAMTVVVVSWAAQAGAQSYDREHCGPQATDCDLGFLMRGLPWAGVALLGLAMVVVGLEVLLARRRSSRVDHERTRELA
jgi:hypothetical protein